MPENWNETHIDAVVYIKLSGNTLRWQYVKYKNNCLSTMTHNIDRLYRLICYEGHMSQEKYIPSQDITTWNVWIIICEMKPSWTKHLAYFNTIWDIVTKVVPSCSLYLGPSCPPNLTFLLWFSSRLAYFSILFSFVMTCVVVQVESTINNMHKLANFGETSTNLC